MHQTFALGSLAALLLSCTTVPPPARRGPSAGNQAPPASNLPVMRAHFIDVGQGDAILLEFPCAAMLVDRPTEKNEDFDGTKALRDYLEKFFARRTDLKHEIKLLAITHPHIDHTRGITSVLLAPGSPFKISNVITNGQETSSGGPQQKKLHELASTTLDVRLRKITLKNIPEHFGLTGPIIDPIKCPDVDPVIRVLYSSPDTKPNDWRPHDFENQNNHSMVIRVDFGATSFLLVGDLEEKGLGELGHHAGVKLMDVDVLKVGHHGSYNATPLGLLQLTSPDIAVIMMGSFKRQVPWSAWAYGHPHQDAIKLLLAEVTIRRKPPVSLPVATWARSFQNVKIDRAIYGTGWDGTVIIEARTRGKAWSVRPDARH